MSNGFKINSETEEKNSRDLQCTVFPGKFCESNEHTKLYNNAYNHWKDTWGDIFKEAGSPESLDCNNFLRQDAIVTLHIKCKVIGLITVSRFNSEQEVTKDHHYLNKFPSVFRRELLEDKNNIFLVMEYLSTHPNWRKSETDLPIGSILLGFAQEIFKQWHGKVMLGTAWKAPKVDKMCSEFGYTQVGTTCKYGLDCSLIYATQQSIRKHPILSPSIEAIWNRRLDLLNENPPRQMVMPQMRIELPKGSLQTENRRIEYGQTN